MTRSLVRARARVRAAGGALAVLAAAGLPALAFAAEAAEEHGGEGSWNPLQGDFGNFVWTVVVLLVVFWVLSRYAWGPLLETLQGRERYIADSLEKAKSEREAAETRLAEYEERLAGARQEVEGILEEARRDAAAVREREEAAARAEAERMVDRARREIDIAKDTAVKELYAKASTLATAAASRILERELRPEDHERLVAEAIDSVERMESERGGRPAAH